jgi:DNA (cytosine-5)-methyltransferase 1
LQGFPADYNFIGSLDEKFTQIGNAVPPTFSAYLAAAVLGELLGAPPTRKSFNPGVEQALGKSFSRVIPSLKARKPVAVDCN